MSTAIRADVAELEGYIAGAAAVRGPDRRGDVREANGPVRAALTRARRFARVPVMTPVTLGATAASGGSGGPGESGGPGGPRGQSFGR